jgi:hypothetical protein
MTSNMLCAEVRPHTYACEGILSICAGNAFPLFQFASQPPPGWLHRCSLVIDAGLTCLVRLSKLEKIGLAGCRCEQSSIALSPNYCSVLLLLHS